MRIKQLHIHRLPGFRQGLPPFHDLAAQVNIIAGRNGSGKSSTARAIRSLLWWDGARGHELMAQLLHHGELHTITIESPAYSHQTGELTTSSSFSDLPPELNQQYLLSLHGLIKDDNTALAHAINKQLTGGFDLQQAKRTLGYGNGTTTRQNSAYSAYDQAQKRRIEIEHKQEELKRKAETIAELKAKMAEAQQAQHQSLLYQKYIEYKEADNQYRVHQRNIDSYSPRLSHYRSDDLDRIKQLKVSIELLNSEITGNKERLSEARRRLSELTIPSATAVDPLFWERLTGYTEQLISCEKEIVEAEAILLQLEEQGNSTAMEMGQLPSEESPLPLETISSTELITIEVQTQQLNQRQQEQQLLEASIRQLRNEIEAIELPDKLQETVDRLNRGIHSLSDWLKEEVKTAPPSPLIGRLLLSVALLATIIQVVYPSFTIAISSLLLLVVGISYTLYYIGGKRKKSEQLLRLEQKYRQCGLDMPESWESEPVTATLQSLLSQLTTIQQKREQKSRAIVAIQQKEDELTITNRRLEEAMSTITHLFTHQIGFIPTAFQKQPIAVDNCSLFIRQWEKWKQLTGEAAGWRRRLNHQQKQRESALNQINQELTVYGLPPVGDGVTAQSLYKHLIAEEQERKQIENSNRSLQLLINTNQLALTEKQEELSRIYQRLQLTDEQEEIIRQLSQQYPAYLEEKDKVYKIQSIKDNLYASLAKHQLFSEDLLTLSLEEAIERQQRYAQEASRREHYLSELTSIETKVSDRMRSDELEKALAEEANCRLLLSDSFEQVMRNKTGELLVEQLKQETTLHNNNPLFVEANRLLAQFTAGEYALLIDEGENNSFKALETKTQRELNIHEISTGTRIQLLLATRLAYIREQEKGETRFPILIDELLANSDDLRSEAMIHTLLEISKERQLFYFTAQVDEVAKWEKALESTAEIEKKIYRLGEIDLSHPTLPTERLQIELYPQLPSCEGADHARYGQLLQVPPFDLIEQAVSELHLWYLVDDVAQIYTLLRHRTDRWGQLSAAKNRMMKIADITDSQWEVMEQKVALLTELVSLYRIGRAKKLTAEELYESDLFNRNFEEALALLKECDYRSDRFLELSVDRLHRFGEGKRTKLKEYLIQQGKLDDRLPLTEEELLQRLAITAQQL
ncbi:AAA family ATPase, partial [Parabacteroides sp. OttesenSCG-928-N08]|nr:AAA family ATPase [Parabacteroides sp. OttesenSCG-928-N08]